MGSIWEPCTLVGSQPCVFSQSSRWLRAKASGPLHRFYGDSLTSVLAQCAWPPAAQRLFCCANMIQSGPWLCPQAQKHQSIATSSKLMNLYPGHI